MDQKQATETEKIQEFPSLKDEKIFLMEWSLNVVYIISIFVQDLGYLDVKTMRVFP